jgi:hypothetical protein
MFQYGFTRENKSYHEGAEIIYSFYQPDGSHIEISNYHLTRLTHEKSIDRSRLTHIQWHDLEVSTGRP